MAFRKESFDGDCNAFSRKGSILPSLRICVGEKIICKGSEISDKYCCV